MGSTVSCVQGSGASSEVHPAAPATARVIAADGSLKELPASGRPLAASASHALRGGAEAAAAAFFLCDSDALCFDQPPPALGAAEPLRPGQLYFVLPAPMLGRPLSSAAMAALAVRAAAALEAKKPQRRRRRDDRVCKPKRVRVVPAVPEECNDAEG